METLYENFIGPFIFVSLILLIIFAFILPLTKFSQRFRISETYFIITNICGFICGALGIIAILFYDPEMVQLYWWKILIIPYVYLQIYIIYVMISKKTLNILDEKQEFNMTTAGGITLGVTIILMAWVVLPLIQNNVIELSLLFPFYVNTVILIFSVVTLFLFKRA
jgi:hypothetical protein